MRWLVTKLVEEKYEVELPLGSTAKQAIESNYQFCLARRIVNQEAVPKVESLPPPGTTLEGGT